MAMRVEVERSDPPVDGIYHYWVWIDGGSEDERHNFFMSGADLATLRDEITKEIDRVGIW